MAGPLPDPVGSKTQDWLRGTPTEIGGATAGSQKGAPSLPEGRGRLLRPCALSRRWEKSLLQRVPGHGSSTWNGTVAGASGCVADTREDEPSDRKWPDGRRHERS